jgi:hypothetical protein
MMMNRLPEWAGALLEIRQRGGVLLILTRYGITYSTDRTPHIRVMILIPS